MPVYDQQELAQRLSREGVRPLQVLSGKPGAKGNTLETLGIKPEAPLAITPPPQDTGWNRILGGHAP